MPAMVTGLRRHGGAAGLGYGAGRSQEEPGAGNPMALTQIQYACRRERSRPNFPFLYGHSLPTGAPPQYFLPVDEYARPDHSCADLMPDLGRKKQIDDLPLAARLRAPPSIARNRQ